MMKNIIFYLGMSTLFTHELDAVPNHEWRILPIVSGLPDETGMTVFILAHIPLFAILMMLVSSKKDIVRTRSKIAVSAFLVVHGVLHTLFMTRENYDFSSNLSNALIFGAALLGGLYLVLEFVETRQE